MQLLISFCNLQNQDVKPNLVLLNTKTKTKTWIKFPNSNSGVTGLAQDDKFIYALYQAETPGIVFIDKKNLNVVLDKTLEKVKDPHSLVIRNNEIFIVSTGTDSIYRYKLNADFNDVKFDREIWRPKDSKALIDTHHLNSISTDEENTYVSCFGPKNGDRWHTAKDGYIWNVTKNEKAIGGIYHPHTVLINNKQIYYIESSTRSIKKNNKIILKLHSGYTRGLVIHKNYLIIGSSSGRKKSKSTGIINNIADPGILEPSCKIALFKKPNIFSKYEKLEEFDFFPEHQEIYDIIKYSD